LSTPNESDRDPSLLAGLRRGDRHALEVIYLAYKDDLLTLATYLVGQSWVAEDILQDVFVRLVRGSQGFRSCDNLRAYLVASCRNRSLDWIRQARRDTVSREDLSDRESAETAPSDALAGEDEKKLIDAAMGSLPAEQRETVVLHVYGRLTFREIGEITGVSANTAQSRYRYALGTLREVLTRKGARPC